MTEPAPARTFTVAEANALLPFVRAQVAELRTCMGRLRAMAPRGLDQSPEAVPHATDTAVPGAYFEALERLSEAAGRLAAEGVQVKDPDAGLVDFPASARGRIVLLCWRDGEDDVAWYHEVDAGFAGRKPLSDLVLDTET